MLRVAGWLVVGIVVLSVILAGGLVMRACEAVEQVAQDELSPRALFDRYEWFKDAAAALDARQASIRVYEGRFARLREQYEGAPRRQWARDDREQANLWESEMAGLIASYNNLAAEYNAAMAKINWRFTNLGDLPIGASIVLPREFRTYQEGAVKP